MMTPRTTSGDRWWGKDSKKTGLSCEGQWKLKDSPRIKRGIRDTFRTIPSVQRDRQAHRPQSQEKRGKNQLLVEGFGDCFTGSNQDGPCQVQLENGIWVDTFTAETTETPRMTGKRDHACQQAKPMAKDHCGVA